MTLRTLCPSEMLWDHVTFNRVSMWTQCSQFSRQRLSSMQKKPQKPRKLQTSSALAQNGWRCTFASHNFSLLHSFSQFPFLLSCEMPVAPLVPSFMSLKCDQVHSTCEQRASQLQKALRSNSGHRGIASRFGVRAQNCSTELDCWTSLQHQRVFGLWTLKLRGLE